MARNNKTIDRMQAIWNMIGGDTGADDLIEGRAKLSIQYVKTITDVEMFQLQSGWSCLSRLFSRSDLYMTDDFRRHILPRIDVKRGLHNHDSKHGFYHDVIRHSTHDEVRVQMSQLHCFKDINQLFMEISRMIEGENPELHSDGKTNVFYVDLGNKVEFEETVQELAISIYREGDEWIFSLFDPAEHGILMLSAGTRVFSF